MPEYHTLKVPKKIHNIFERYIRNNETIYESGTAMIQDLIKNRAQDLLEEMKEKSEKK